MNTTATCYKSKGRTWAEILKAEADRAKKAG